VVVARLSILAVAGLRLRSRTNWWKRAHTAALSSSCYVILLWLGATFSALTPDRPLSHPRVELAAMDALNHIAPHERWCFA